MIATVRHASAVSPSAETASSVTDWMDAASVGRLDESKLYYLRSRGLSESQARRLMVDARFAPAIEKIPLEELRTEVRETVARRLDDEQLDG